MWNADAFAPLMPMDVMLRSTLPPLASVKAIGVLVLPIFTPPKVPFAGESTASGVDAAAPVPDRLALCVPTLSTTFSEADALPVADGLKLTPIEQEPPAANALPQVFVAILKEDALVPPMSTDVIGSAALPALVKVNVFAELVLPTLTFPKEALDGDSAACGAEPVVPVPERLAVCVPTLSTTEREADALPAAEGLKVTATVQLAPLARDEPQVFAPILNTAAFVPPTAIEVMASAALPPLVSVKVWGALDDPVVTLPKFALAGVSAACGAVAPAPAPVSEAV
jgi:hypothetical protein